MSPWVSKLLLFTKPLRMGIGLRECESLRSKLISLFSSRVNDLHLGYQSILLSKNGGWTTFHPLSRESNTVQCSLDSEPLESHSERLRDFGVWNEARIRSVCVGANENCHFSNQREDCANFSIKSICLGEPPQYWQNKPMWSLHEGVLQLGSRYDPLPLPEEWKDRWFAIHQLGGRFHALKMDPVLSHWEYLAS